MSAAEWITKRRELLDAATEGPWGTFAAYGSRGVSASEGDEMLFIETYGVTYAAHAPDAALIADARTSLPRALDALEAVLALHSQHNSYLHYCRADGEKYPCPTVTAIEAALRGES